MGMGIVMSNPHCPHSAGQLAKCSDPGQRRCASCQTEIRTSVVERMDSFKRVADSGGPAAAIAKAALGYEV